MVLEVSAFSPAVVWGPPARSAVTSCAMDGAWTANVCACSTINQRFRAWLLLVQTVSLHSQGTACSTHPNPSPLSKDGVSLNDDLGLNSSRAIFDSPVCFPFCYSLSRIHPFPV